MANVENSKVFAIVSHGRIRTSRTQTAERETERKRQLATNNKLNLSFTSVITLHTLNICNKMTDYYKHGSQKKLEISRYK